MAITDEQRAIFEQVLAAACGNPESIALLETKEKSTGRNALLLAMVVQDGEFFDVVPLAELIMPGDLQRYEEPK